MPDKSQSGAGGNGSAEPRGERHDVARSGGPQVELSATFFRTLAALLAILVAYVAFRIRVILVVLFFAVVFASAIRPLVAALTRRRVPMPVSVLALYVALVASLIGLLVLIIPESVVMARELKANDIVIDASREIGERLTEFGWDQFGIVLPAFQIPGAVQGAVSEAEATARRQAWPWTWTALSIVGYALLGLVMAYYWLAARAELLELALRLSPPGQRHRFEILWTDIERTLGAYVRAEGLLMLAVGAASYVGLTLLGVPHALTLATIAGLTEAIPILGPFIGAIPAVLMAWSVSPTVGVLTVVLYIVVQQVESTFLVPKVMHRNLGINPLLVISALAAGGVLGGPLGALLATPIVGALQVVTRHLWLDPSVIAAKNGLVLVGTEESRRERGTPDSEVARPGS